jgi:hypothetical protein
VRDKARQELAAKIKDPIAFNVEMRAARMIATKLRERDVGPPPGFSAKLTNVKIEGNKATATVVASVNGKEVGKDTLKFEKVGASWTIVPDDVIDDDYDKKKGKRAPDDKKG